MSIPPLLTPEKLKEIAELQEEYPPELVEKILRLEKKEQIELKRQFEKFQKETEELIEQAKRRIVRHEGSNRRDRRIAKAHSRRMSTPSIPDIFPAETPVDPSSET